MTRPLAPRRESAECEAREEQRRRRRVDRADRERSRMQKPAEEEEEDLDSSLMSVFRAECPSSQRKSSGASALRLYRTSLDIDFPAMKVSTGMIAS